MKSYTPTIGLEVHAELKTTTKMFCDSKNDPHDAKPNLNVCPVCMAHPGTLPVINKEAVKHVLRVGVALKGTLASYTEFDRKNYFYPDIPKGYQISQYEYPLVKGGELHGVRITRIHLEEDTARSQHEERGSIVDYNRAGVPLMELVTEPVIHDAKSAGDFARELQLLLRTLSVSGANMERGEMRVEANISVSTNDSFGTKVEVKNLNSFKSVEGAIEYEIRRQTELLERGGSVVQETRGWDENKGKTFSQRVKESAHDYRYFPDPDLPKLNLLLSDEFSLSRLEESLPQSPDAKRSRYEQLGLPREQSEILVSNLDLGNFFETVLKKSEKDLSVIKMAVNYLTSDVISVLERENADIKAADHEHFIELMQMVVSSQITSRVAKDLLREVLFGDARPGDLAAKAGLLQKSSMEDLLPVVHEVISAHPRVVEEYRSGKESALQFLVGQGMRVTKGSANPSLLLKLLKDEIG